jgi:hypothetical protein
MTCAQRLAIRATQAQRSDRSGEPLDRVEEADRGGRQAHADRRSADADVARGRQVIERWDH